MGTINELGGILSQLCRKLSEVNNLTIMILTCVWKISSKFRFSEKAKKIRSYISLRFAVTNLSMSKPRGRQLQIFVAFWENLNFTTFNSQNTSIIKKQSTPLSLKSFWNMIFLFFEPLSPIVKTVHTAGHLT